MTISLTDQIYASNSAQTVTCVRPGGAPANGDLLIAQGIRDTAGGNNFANANFTVRSVATYAGRSIAVAYRVCDGSETATHVFDWGANGGNYVFLTRWAGNWATPFDTDQEAAVSATATISVTPASGKSALLIGQIMNYQLNSCAPAAGNTEILDQALGGSNVRWWSGYRIQNPTSGSYTVGGTLSGGGFQDAKIRALSFIEAPAPVGRSRTILAM